MPSDPLKPTVALLCKLGSIARHVQEGFAGEGHPFDLTAASDLAADPEVREWMAAMDGMALLPVMRRGPSDA